MDGAFLNRPQKRIGVNSIKQMVVLLIVAPARTMSPPDVATKPRHLQLFDQPYEVGKLQLWSGDSGDAGNNLRRIWFGTLRMRSDSGGDTR